MAKQKILILGGGFGGLRAAEKLAQSDEFEVTLISDNPDFRFYPSLYETAVGHHASASSIPLREILPKQKINLVIGKATKLDRASKTVATASGQKLTYDKLIVALGVVTNFFGIKGLAEHAYGIKTVDEAEKLRAHIHSQIVGGQNDNYVIIGGGPTGVELAGALAGYIAHVRTAHKIDSPKPHIDLVEAAPRLMPRMPASYSHALARQLRKLGIQLYLGQSVKAETADQLKLSGHSIDSHSVVWTAGVTNHPFLKDNGFQLSSSGKAMVDSYLSSEPDIFVIGDNADTLYSGMAQTALYDADFVAGNLKRAATGHSTKAYKPNKPVYVTPCGDHWAAVEWGPFKFYGRLGWWVHKAAELVAYHDLEPLKLAAKHWHDEQTIDVSTCPLCGH